MISKLSFNLEGKEKDLLNKALSGIDGFEKTIFDAHDVVCGTVTVPVREVPGNILKQFFPHYPNDQLCEHIMEYLGDIKYKSDPFRWDIRPPCRRKLSTFCVFISDLDYGKYITNTPDFKDYFPSPGIYIREHKCSPESEPMLQYRAIKKYAVMYEALKAYIYYSRPRMRISIANEAEPLILSTLSLMAMDTTDLQEFLQHQGHIGGSWAIIPYLCPEKRIKHFLNAVWLIMPFDAYIEGEAVDIHKLGQELRETLESF